MVTTNKQVVVLEEPREIEIPLCLLVIGSLFLENKYYKQNMGNK